MKISIVTTFFNAEPTIRDTIESVVRQQYNDIECIFIDSASTDRSLAIVNEYLPSIPDAIVVSEPDNGIYEGMNKGVVRASGEVVAILNADDFFERGVVARVAEIFQSDSDIDIVAGSIRKFDSEQRWHEKCRRSQLPELGPFNPAVHHPAIFVRRRVYEELGGFDLSFKISADYEFISRCIGRGFKTFYTDEVLTCVRVGGFSDGLSNHFQKNREHLLIGARHAPSFGAKCAFAMKVAKKTLLQYLHLKSGRADAQRKEKGDFDEIFWFK